MRSELNEEAKEEDLKSETVKPKECKLKELSGNWSKVNL
jgi:hypothetical protein